MSTRLKAFELVAKKILAKFDGRKILARVEIILGAAIKKTFYRSKSQITWTNPHKAKQ